MNLTKNQRRLLEWLDGKKGTGYHVIGNGSYQFDNILADSMIEKDLIEMDKAGIRYRITAKGRKAFKAI